MALSYCNKQNFCLLHWVTTTINISIYYQKDPKRNKKCPKKCKKRHTSLKKCSKEVKRAPKKERIVDTFGHFLATYTNFVCCSDSVWQTFCLFVAVIRCNKLNFCLSPWLSATNNIDKNFLFISGMWQRNWKKGQNQTSFHIWISPALSNCFGVENWRAGNRFFYGLCHALLMDLSHNLGHNQWGS